MPAATFTQRRDLEPQAAKTGSIPLAGRTLGKTGLKVTTVGFGCMVTTDASVVERGAEMGINYFDTARVYGNGNNERMVASALKGRRQKVILSSKSVARTAAEARAHLETSLKELQTDYLDIWYMHFRDNPSAITGELLAVWEDAKKQGKIRHIGVSTHNPTAIADRVIETGKIEVVLSVCNFAIGAAHDAAFERLHKAGIGLVAMKVMAPASRAFGFKSSGEHMSKPGGALAALKWVLKDRRFATAIPGMTDMEQLEENSAPWRSASSRATRSCWRRSMKRSGRCTAACATAARGNARKARRSRRPCGICLTPISTGSSRWGASTLPRCPGATAGFAARIARNARCAAPTACMWPSA